MDDLVIHPATIEAVNRFLQFPAHAIIVVGPTGIGKKALVNAILRRSLNLPDDEALEKYPYKQFVAPPKDKQSISIEAIRDLQQFAKLKVPTGQQSQRFLVIHEAHMLTTEAQNALLKLLEEPPAGTTIILTAADEDALLPTIRSRAQRLQVHRPNKLAVIGHFESAGHGTKDVQQTYMLSGGLPGLQHALLQSTDHPLAKAVQTARTILQADSFGKLAMVDELAKKRPDCFQLFFVMQHMAQAAIEQAAKQGQGDPVNTDKRLRQWHKVFKASYQAEEALRHNAQAKLVLDSFMLSL
jgi:hypothetical protein